MTGAEVATTRGSLAVRPDQVEWTPQQRAALAQIGIDEAPAGDQLVFLHVAQKMGLDPFNKEIYMIGRWDSELQRKKWTIQVGIDGFRSKSEEHPEFGGIEGPEWCGTDGQWHDVWTGDGPPVAARVLVYRKDWDRPAVGVAHYKEYVQTKRDGSPTAMWASKPAGQLGKCAEALARRKAFPRRLTGVYIEEELQHLNNPQPPMVIDSTREDTQQSVQEEPDWDMMIHDAEWAGDKEALTKVWALAKGMRRNDTALLNKIAEAGERIKKAGPKADAPAETTATNAEAAPDK
jgi:phage recombination protein Bet